MTMPSISGDLYLEEMMDLFVVTGQQGPLEYSLIAGLDESRTKSASQRVLNELGIKESIGIFGTNIGGTNVDEGQIYAVMFPTHINITYSDSVKGLEVEDLGNVRDQDDFQVQAEIVVNEHYRQYIQLLQLSRELTSAHESEDKVAWDNARDNFKKFIPRESLRYVKDHLNEIGWLSQQKGDNRDKLIDLRCQAIDAVLKEDYKRAGRISKMYDRMLP